jgi:hypothetical protein
MGSGCCRTAGTGGPSCTRTPAMRRDSGAGPRSRRAVGVGVYRRPRLQRAHAGLKLLSSSVPSSAIGVKLIYIGGGCAASPAGPAMPGEHLSPDRLPASTARGGLAPSGVPDWEPAPVVPLWYRKHRPMSPERPGAWTWGAQWTLRDGSARPIEPGSGLARSIRGNVGSDAGSSLGLFRPLRRGSRPPIAA